MTVRTCIKGKRYPDLIEARIALANNLINGRSAEGFYLCNRCGGYHIGGTKKKVTKCWATAKIEFKTPNEADAALLRTKSKGRGESGYYRCKYCHNLHLTSAHAEKKLGNS